MLHDYVSDELEQLEQFLAFLDAPEYRPGETVLARWDERRDLLMGRRRPDGRTLDVGKLWTLRRVALVRRSEGHWQGAPPVLVDTPWIPQFHEARRVDLIIEQARGADIAVILALPQPFQFEEWVPTVLTERPELAKRTLIVFNQVDTVDTLALFARHGFASNFKENAERLAKHGIDPRNLYMACARLPFLLGSAQDAAVAERIAKLRKVLGGIRKLVAGRGDSDFKTRMLAPCDPDDGGLGSVRRRLEELAAEFALRQRAREALAAIEALHPTLTLSPDAARTWSGIATRAAEMRAVVSGP
ncbi:MAG: GTPase domain-containing protein [Planctomycetota bacterium]|nr:GTPase domain-containing protein [Planctomycetota bacterium]